MRPHVRLICFVITVVLLGFSNPATARIYKWVDAEGRVHYSNIPPPGSKSAPPAPLRSPARTSPAEPRVAVQERGRAQKQFEGDEPFSRIENTSQINGCWKRINFSEQAMKKMNKFEIYPAKYQWYCFLERGELRTLHSNWDGNYSASELIEKTTIFPSVEEYSIPKAGIIFIHHKDARQKTYWVSSLLTRNIILGGVELEEGDAVMTIRDIKTGKDIYYRFLRKVNNF